MKKHYKIFMILFLNMAVNQIYGSYNNNRTHQSFNHSYNNNQFRPKFNRNSAFATHQEALEEQTFKAINESYRQQVQNKDATRLISSIIAVATQKAQSLALNNQIFSKKDICQYCNNNGYLINENIINNYLEYTQNEPRSFEEVLKKAYESGQNKK